jgi:hypothetical protein
MERLSIVEVFKGVTTRRRVLKKGYAVLSSTTVLLINAHLHIHRYDHDMPTLSGKDSAIDIRFKKEAENDQKAVSQLFQKQEHLQNFPKRVSWLIQICRNVFSRNCHSGSLYQWSMMCLQPPSPAHQRPSPKSPLRVDCLRVLPPLPRKGLPYRTPRLLVRGLSQMIVLEE